MLNFYPRTSIVDHLSIFSVSQASFLRIGDSKQIRAKNNVIAVQQATSNFEEDLYSFYDLEIFQRPEPMDCFDYDTKMCNFHANPVIKVHHLYITGAAGSSVVHIGSLESFHNDTRIHHIRDFRTFQEIKEEHEKKNQEKGCRGF